MEISATEVSSIAAPTADLGQVGDGFDAVRASYPPILNTAQVAELLDLNPRTVLNMAGDGRLPASRLPGSRKFHFLLEEIVATLKANKVTPPGDQPAPRTG